LPTPASFNPRSARVSGATYNFFPTGTTPLFQSALRSGERSDAIEASKRGEDFVFQSALRSGERSDRQHAAQWHCSTGFNPRSARVSGATLLRVLLARLQLFQSALRSGERSDTSFPTYIFQSAGFNPRSARVSGATVDEHAIICDSVGFNPRSARVSGATALKGALGRVEFVSIRAPLG